jgi:hypothetical protein
MTHQELSPNAEPSGRDEHGWADQQQHTHGEMLYEDLVHYTNACALQPQSSVFPFSDSRTNPNHHLPQNPGFPHEVPCVLSLECLSYQLWTSTTSVAVPSCFQSVSLACPLQLFFLSIGYDLLIFMRFHGLLAFWLCLMQAGIRALFL